MRQLLPTSFFGWLVLALVALATAYLVFVYLLFPLLIPTEWGGATQ
jgi:hypothetical protein